MVAEEALADAPRPQGRPEKRQSIVTAARTVFGREGYSRASVDSIAAAAGVSKRTIYNHFGDKERLFLSVIQEGAQIVARTHADLADRHLRKILDLETDLGDFAIEWASSPAGLAWHFALVRTIQAEAAHIPAEAIGSWRAAGPEAFRVELAGHLRRIADAGHLSIPDGDESEAAEHFNLLTFVRVMQRTFYGALDVDPAEIEDLVRRGVATFLRLYGVDQHRPDPPRLAASRP